MAKIIGKAPKKMTELCRKVVQVNIRWSTLEQISVIKRFFKFIWNRIVFCSLGNPKRYRRLTRLASSLLPETSDIEEPTTNCSVYDADSDLVSLKICLLGDTQIGKTSFVIKYVGDEQENRILEMTGLNIMDKTVIVEGAKIGFNIWDVGGDHKSAYHIPIACKDSVAVLFMFDLTCRSTLYSVIVWYNQSRKHNQTAIPILIGTKFDDFIRLPPDLQWTIVTQARTYARIMKATLFFSSSSHNINVNKIFKFIMAKLFGLPWTLERNLTLGEPIIDF